MESTDDELNLDITKDALRVVARKPFVLESIDPNKDKEKEMEVFTAAKKLSEYIFVVTQNAPSKFRWSIVTRLQNTSVEIIEALYLANFERGNERLKFQKTAGTKLRLLDHYAEVGYKLKLFPFRRLGVITRYIVVVRNLLAGWTKSTQRYEKLAEEKSRASTQDDAANDN